MPDTAVRKRRMELLRELGTKAGGRHDIKVPLSEAASALSVTSYAGGSRFTDKDKAQYEGGSDQAYDLNTLLEEGFIAIDHMTVGRDSLGGATYADPAVKVSLDGFTALREWKGS